MVQRFMPVDGPRWMVGCEYVIYQGGEFCLGLLAVCGADNKNDTKSREHFQAQKLNKYNQRYGQSNAIKAIWLAIQSGWTRGW